MSGRGSSGGRGRGGGRGGGGRGEYYKKKYGGGGRGGRGGRGDRGDSGGSGGRGGDSQGGSGGSGGPRLGGNNGGSYEDLISLLHSIDNRSYPAYHDIESSTTGWRFSPQTSSSNDRSPSSPDGPFSLYVGRAQSDPFAAPTRCRIVVPAATARFPKALYANKVRAVALADYVNRAFHGLCQRIGADQAAGGGGGGRGGGRGGGWSGPKGGDIAIARPCQHVLEQTAVSVDPLTGDATAQFTVNLPARGRTILGSQAIDIFERVVPSFVSQSLVHAALNAQKLQHHVMSVEDQRWLRAQLGGKGLVAFVPDGAVLPRASGADDAPMGDTAENRVVRFGAPEETVFYKLDRDCVGCV